METLTPAKRALISQLWVMFDDSSKSDWDGYGAEVLNGVAVAAAATFIRAMPEGVPLPEIAPEPDGSVSLDWIQSRDRMFSISIGSTDRLAAAWLDGSDKGHFVARFDPMKVPLRILQGIQSITHYGRAALRTS